MLGSPPPTAFIVRACNSHEDILKAALGVVWKLTRKENLTGDPRDTMWAKIDINDACIRQLKEAIAKAEGK